MYIVTTKTKNHLSYFAKSIRLQQAFMKVHQFEYVLDNYRCNDCSMMQLILHTVLYLKIKDNETLNNENKALVY